MSRSAVTEENGIEVALQNWQCDASALNRSSANVSLATEETSTIAEGADWAAWATA
jgi:hypothetical protein